MLVLCDPGKITHLPDVVRASRLANKKGGAHGAAFRVMIVRINQFMVKYFTLGWSSGSTSMPTPSAMPQFSTWWWMGM